ncbi:ATP-grasp domain-containing protein [Patescibacteria group bacterium]|nr:ATP-grasp domain-containing protein [Patescibacteria group bacterium]
MSNSKKEFLGKKILLVNTGSSIKKKFTVERLKKLGLTIIALNKEINWAKPYVDHWILADTANHQESLQAAKAFASEHPNLMFEGVITFWEDDVLLTSKISDAFNLIGIPHATAQKARNKYLFRDFCRQNNLPTPQNQLVRTKKDLNYVKKHLRFPLVIKPAYGSSSAYVIKINNPQELEDAYLYIKKSLSTEVESALTDGLDIIVEEYIDGDEVDIDILLQNGRMKFFSVSDNDKTAEPYFLETGHSIPSNLPIDDQEALIAMADETLEKLNIQNGCIHFEAKVTNEGPVPIEVNLRMGGDEIHAFINYAWHVDLIEYAAKIALGVNFPKIIKPQKPFDYLISQDFLPEHSGILSQFEIDSEIKKQKNILELKFHKKIGDPVLSPPDGYEFLGWITTKGDNFNDAQDNLEEAIKCVHYEIARFHSLSSIGKTERKNKFAAATFKKEFLVKAAKLEKIKHNAYQSINIGIINPKKNGRATDSLLTQSVKTKLQNKGFKLFFLDFNDLTNFGQKVKEYNIHLLLNLTDDYNKESSAIQALIEPLNIPIIGSDLFCDKLTKDSLKTRKLLSFHEIPIIEWEFINSESDAFDIDLNFPVKVREKQNYPRTMDNNSWQIIKTKNKVVSKIRSITNNFTAPAYLEEYIKGQTFHVLIYGNPPHNLNAFPIVQYGNNQAKISSPKKFNRKLNTLITEMAFDSFSILGCADLALVEILVDDDHNPIVTNIEAQPLIRNTQEIKNILKIAKIPVVSFIEDLLNSAIQRYKEKPSILN